MDNYKTEQTSNLNISYEDLMKLDIKEFNTQLQKLINKTKEKDFSKCIENILKNNDTLKNYIFFIKYIKCNQKSKIDDNKIEQLFKKYKDDFNTYINSINNKEKNKNFEDLDYDNVISILKDFPKYLLYIYNNKDEIYDFIIEKKENFDISDKQKFNNFFEILIKRKKINGINLYGKFLMDLEKREGPFTKKEELEFYEFLFKEYNYYKNNIKQIQNKKFIFKNG